MPYAVRWKDIRIGFTHDKPPNSQALVALNGTLVGLVVDPTQYVPGGGPRAAEAAAAAEAAGLPGLLAQAPPPQSGAHCVGLGIVSRVDVAEQQLFVLTPVPLEVLEQVNTLLKGTMEIPALMRSYDDATGVYASPLSRAHLRKVLGLSGVCRAQGGGGRDAVLSVRGARARGGRGRADEGAEQPGAQGQLSLLHGCCRYRV